MGAGEGARPQDIKMAFELGQSVARQGWVLLSGGRNAGIMDAVSKGAKAGGGLTIGIVPDSNKNALSDAVDVGIVTGMGSARNYINVLSSDVVITCGFGGSGTASEIALALKSKRRVILLNDRPESYAYFKMIGKDLVHATDSVEATVALVRELLATSS
jgi:uncharacterized protein (TIGR00725 family)